MTESEWLACQTRPMGLFRYVQRKTTNRKLQLIGCGACRHVEVQLMDVRLQNALVALEQYADGLLSESKFVKARDEAWEAVPDHTDPFFNHVDIQQIAARAVSAVVNPAVQSGTWRTIEILTMGIPSAKQKGYRKQAGDDIRNKISAVIHEVIGNPFQKWSRTAPWSAGGLIQPDGRTVELTDTVRGLAETVHQLQAFDRLPILADALEEAGITDTPLLAHCRSEEPHIRGCWALDVVRGKT